MGGFRARAGVTMFSMLMVCVISVALARSDAPATGLSASLACLGLTLGYLVAEAGGSLSVEFSTSRASGAAFSLQLHGGRGHPDESNVEAFWPPPSSSGPEKHCSPPLPAGSYSSSSSSSLAYLAYDANDDSACYNSDDYQTFSMRSAVTSGPPPSPTSSIDTTLQQLRKTMMDESLVALRRWSASSRGGGSRRSRYESSVARQDRDAAAPAGSVDESGYDGDYSSSDSSSGRGSQRASTRRRSHRARCTMLL